jgi:predicted  nucleic acid-binding Zn-ribbon protein
MTRLWGIALLLVSLTAAVGQRRRDVLNPLEVDQLRDAAQEPDKRLKLYIQFARERLALLEKAGSDPKVTNRGQETHDRLEEFLSLYDEFDRNIDTFADRQEDLRKTLKAVLEADTEFQAKLRALKDSAETSKSEARQYEFVLTSAIEAVDAGVSDHQQLLAQQEKAFKKKKKRKQ